MNPYHAAAAKAAEEPCSTHYFNSKTHMSTMNPEGCRPKKTWSWEEKMEAIIAFTKHPPKVITTTTFDEVAASAGPSTFDPVTGDLEQFRLLPNLPTELRLMIFNRMPLPQRTIRIRCAYPRRWKPLTHSAPTVLHINKESRAEILKVYQQFRAAGLRDVHFNYEADTLDLRARSLLRFWKIHHRNTLTITPQVQGATRFEMKMVHRLVLSSDTGLHMDAVFVDALTQLPKLRLLRILRSKGRYGEHGLIWWSYKMSGLERDYKDFIRVMPSLQLPDVEMVDLDGSVRRIEAT